MPDPRDLKVGDRVRFVSEPEEWADPKCTVPSEDVALMKAMIARSWPSRICRIDENGVPWIEARMGGKGGIEYHSWCIHEKTGWRQVRKRR